MLLLYEEEAACRYLRNESSGLPDLRSDFAVLSSRVHFCYCS